MTLMKRTCNQQSSKSFYYDKIANGKIDFATAGLFPFIYKHLTQNVSSENALNIAEYILAMKTETNLSDMYRTTIIQNLSFLSRFSNNKTFAQMTRDEILVYLDSIRKSDVLDPLHKWIGTYNLRRTILLRFFKWLYFPNEEPKRRKIPAVIENIPMLKRREQSIYKPTDLWTLEDDLLFLKYCPNKRDRCYHTISRDMSCRPHEILTLRIRDVIFKTTTDNYQYAEVLVNGKTGSRSTPLFNSIPYIKDWLDEHIQRGNPNAFLIPSRDRKNFGKRLAVKSINTIYRFYKSKYFPKLLNDPNVPIEDKNKIRELLNKPWNPYIRRHSALTEKSLILKENTLRQHAGWSARSQMHLKYIHYFGNESSESILEAYGIIPKDRQPSDALKPKQCPNCNEPNKPDSRFCAKCRMVLTYDAYNETVESQIEKEDKLKVMEERFNTMQSQMQSLVTTLGNMDQSTKNLFAKQLFNGGVYKKDTNS
jgi:integrase/recombinase XerD